MKLLSLYIDHFGKLEGFSYDFKNKLNTIYEENGFGKSTIAAFLKSMLYGISKEDRQKYTPWKTMSRFGGTLVIESDGIEYRIERLFSPKSKTLDETKIFNIKTGKLVKFEHEIGEEILNLNDESFQRSVFIPQKELDGFTSDIESKLANLIGGTNDTESYEGAVNVIKSQMHELKLNSKKGIIIDKKRELFDVETNINETSSIVAKGKEIQDRIEQIDIKLEEDIKNKENTVDTLYKYSKFQEAKLSNNSQIDKLNELKEAKTILNNNEVSKNEIDTMKTKARKANYLNFEYEILENCISIPDKYADLFKTYNKDTIPTKEKIDEIEECVKKHEAIKASIDSNKKEVKNDKPVKAIFLLIMSTILLIAGLLVLFYLLIIKKNDIPFLIVGGTSLLLSIVGYVFSILSFKKTALANSYKVVGGHVKTYDFEKIRTEEVMREFFGKYHLYSSNYRSNLELLKSNIDKYKEFEMEKESRKKEFHTIKEKIKYIENEIMVFLSRFNIPINLSKYDSILLVSKSLNVSNKLDGIKEENINENEYKNIDIDKLNMEMAKYDENISNLINEKAKYNNYLNDIELDTIKYNELIERKVLLESEIKKLSDEYRILELTLNYLNSSQNALLEKYVKPMKESIKKYIDFILADYKEYNIDVNFNFKFVTESGEKDISNYSKGFQTMISLCMRLALIECLYDKNNPFIVLDDPFVHLDDIHMNVCKSLIEKISKKYQIIYFTCHESRNIILN